MLFRSEQYSSTFVNGTDLDAPEFIITEISSTEFEILFNEPIPIESLPNYISITPSVSFNIEQNKETKKSAIINFSSGIEWNKTYTLKIRKGIKDLSGNETIDDFYYTILNNKEEERPVSFIKGYLKNGTSFKSISSEDFYSTITLSVLDFPTTTGGNTKATDLYFFE